MDSKFNKYLITFFIYTFFGAIAEHISYYFSNTKKTLSNPIIEGFPLYGLVAVIFVFINKYIPKNYLIEFLIYGMVATSIEFVTGLAVGAGPSKGVVDSWDYSNNPLNYKGIIDIYHFIAFGIAGMIIVRINPYLMKLLCV